jgi:1-acyl-sn-glycerol-3-phosphate acyltransferase
MSETGPALDDAEGAMTTEARVLQIVRELAGEVGGSRAQRAVSAHASLEREVGLGSLERVELMLRIERTFGSALDDSALSIDTPADLARAVASAPASRVPPTAGAGAATVGGAPHIGAHASTVHASLWQHAAADPDRPHAYVREDDGVEHEVTYGRLLTEARAVAGALRSRGVGRGDRVAIMLPTGVDFLAVFQGILVAGAVPVPIYPPARLDRLEEYLLRQAAILRDAGARLLVGVPAAAGVAGLLKGAAPDLGGVVSAAALREGDPWPGPEGSGSDAAIIQYTSGSTGQPKGVLLTHENLLANIRAIAAGVGAVPTDVGASWLPLYHDMGLIGSWLFCLCRGLPISILSPLAFLARPERWLWTIHRRRASLSGAPNFAYELCVRKVPETALEGLDLSSWRCALNGAEPVSPDTLDRFARRFEPHGFRREALMPVYGLAESSVALCFPPLGRGPRVDRVSRRALEGTGRAEPAGPSDASALRFVATGRALPEHETRIVDEAGRDLPERTVGRLVFRGPSVTPGYFGKPEATAAMRLPGGWLDSGDLAYVADGEVFIAGRRKDLIIKGGRNLVPQEIEDVAASVEGVRRGCVAAFGVTSADQGTETLVVVAETRLTDSASRDRLVAAITERVAAAVGLPPDAVVIAGPGAVPKTPSGKIRRAAARQMYLDASLGRAGGLGPLRRARLAASATLAMALPRMAVAGRAAYAGYLALALGALALVAWPLALLVPERRFIRLLQRTGARLALWIAGCLGSVEGESRLPASGPCLFVCNHASHADVPALVALLPRPFVFVAKREVRAWPLVGLLVRRAGHLTVDRADAVDGIATAEQVARAIESGESVLVFPEATFTAAAGLRPFRLGAFKAAVDTGAPIVPLALRGTRRVLPEGRLPRPHRIDLWIGEPVAAEGSGFRGIVALRDRVADAIAAHCGEPRLDLVSAGPPQR